MQPGAPLSSSGRLDGAPGAVREEAHAHEDGEHAEVANQQQEESIIPRADARIEHDLVPIELQIQNVDVVF